MIAVMLRACQLAPSESLPVVAQNLHLVQAVSQAFQCTARAQQGMAQQPQGMSGESLGFADEALESTSTELEGTLEGSLLALGLYLAQSPHGAHMLLDQGVADLIPLLAKWLLGPDGGSEPS